MSQPPKGTSRSDMRKAVLRMRLEMHRQELRHETLHFTQPVREMREYSQRLRLGSGPIWLGGGLALLSVLGGKRGWRRWLKLALIALPLLRHRSPPAPKSPAP